MIIDLKKIYTTHLDSIDFFMQDAEPFKNFESKQAQRTINQLHPTLLKRFREISSIKVKAEFLATRHLLSIAFPQTHILAGPKNQPLFPPTLLGSISHKDCKVVVAKSNKSKIPHSGLGVDLERASISLKLKKQIAPNEDFSKLMDEAAFPNEERLLSICFSAKESIYKTLSRHLRSHLGFDDVTLICITQQGTDRGELTFSSDKRELRELKVDQLVVNYQEIVLCNYPYILTYIKI